MAGDVARRSSHVRKAKETVTDLEMEVNTTAIEDVLETFSAAVITVSSLVSTIILRMTAARDHSR